MKIISLFSGIGGFDLGFHQAGFTTVFANDSAKSVRQTFTHNFPDAPFDDRDIRNIPSSDIPDADGIIGGPPCQSWSAMGSGKGMDDERGRLFLEYTRIVKDKQPKFFVAENVKGILANSRSTPLHPSAPKMERCPANDAFRFVQGK